MKICIPVTTPDGLSAALESDFGAAQHLLILDSEGSDVCALDRAHPELISQEAVAGIQGVLCGQIHPRLLMELQHNGIQVFACEAQTAAAALAQFRAGELEAVPPFTVPEEVAGGCCGGHAQHNKDHECCGGKGHDDKDHECCGGKGHADGESGCGCASSNEGEDGGHKHAHAHGSGCGCH